MGVTERPAGFEAGEALVSPDWLAEHREDVTVVDVRDERAFERMGHVPGAVNVPYHAIRDRGGGTEGMFPDPDRFGDLLARAGVDPGDTLVAYDDDRGVYAARFLLTALVCGHRGPLRLLDGDITVWGRDYDTTTEPTARGQTDYDASPPVEGPVVDRTVVEAVQDGDGLLVDTRSHAEFDAANIDGSVQVSWEALVDAETRKLHPRERLEAILEERGITPEESIVLYCNTARRLSHTYVVLQHLGYPDVSVYEGSLTDWIRSEAPQWSPKGIEATVRAYADEGFEATIDALGEDAYNRLKLVGIYGTKHEGYFMLRTKIPGGHLTTDQARVIAEVTDEFARAPAEYGGSEQNPVFGDAYLDVTTRQDVQMHWIRLEDMPAIWERYETVGLTTLQACGNSVRNVVGCPADGLGGEVIEARPIVEAITDRFLGDDHYANMPRKFKVSVTGCRENCARAHINDLGLVPARKDGREGFHVLVGGGLSDGPRMASDLGVFVEPDQVIPLVEATADLFMEQGNYLDIAVNRLRFLVAELGVEGTRKEIERRLPFAFEEGGESLTERYRGDHVGVHEQADGSYYVGLNVPTGRMGWEDFDRLAALADRHGAGEVRLSINQNVLVPHVSAAELDAFLETDLLERYRPDPGPFERGIVTCTGSEFCTYGIIETKERGLRWVRELDDWLAEEFDDAARSALPDAIRIHMSGCSASCAQPQVGDIGLRGETYRDEETGTEPAVDVGLGGSLAAETFIDWVTTELPAAALPRAVKRLVERYHTEHGLGEDGADAGESAPAFREWLRETRQDQRLELVTEGGR